MLKLEDPTLLARRVQTFLWQFSSDARKSPPPFTLEMVVVLGGNIVRNLEGYVTTPYSPGTKKSFGAQGRVIAAACLYHHGVSDCIVLSTGKTDPEDHDAPTEAAVMKAELLSYGVPEACIYLEEGSQTTEENARELAMLLQIQPFQQKKRIGVITSSWHIRRTDAFFDREGVKMEDRTIKYLSSDTLLCRYLPEFKADMYALYNKQEMKKKIQDERNGYHALITGTYQSRQLGEIAEMV